MSHYRVVRVNDIVLDEPRIQKLIEILEEKLGYKVYRYMNTLIIYTTSYNIQVFIRQNGVTFKVYEVSREEAERATQPIVEAMIAADYIVSAEEAGYTVEEIEVVQEQEAEITI